MVCFGTKILNFGSFEWLLDRENVFLFSLGLFSHSVIFYKNIFLSKVYFGNVGSKLKSKMTIAQSFSPNLA
jgi:hypothetical protein